MEINGDRFDSRLNNAGFSVSAEGIQSLPASLRMQIKHHAPSIYKWGISFYWRDHSYIDELNGRFNSEGVISSDQMFKSSYLVEAENVPYFRLNSDGYLDLYSNHLPTEGYESAQVT